MTYIVIADKKICVHLLKEFHGKMGICGVDMLAPYFT